MSRTELLIQEIKSLSPNELETVLREIVQRVESAHRVEELLAKIRGKGKGIWDDDAQEYVNRLRNDDRL